MPAFSVIKACAFASALCLALAGAPSRVDAQADLTVPQAQRLAIGLIIGGRPAAALELINTLQADGRNQTAALFITRSRAERALGEYDAARQSGRMAFDIAATNGEKFLAARVVAQALASAGKRTRAQFWLRRAAQFAPNDRAYALARQDFAYVQSRNPLSYSIDLSVQPTDNINNAPQDNTFEFLGYVFSDPTAVPISGTNIQTFVDLAYRLPATEHRTSQVTLAYAARRVILGSEAATIDPTLTARSLYSDRLMLGWSARLRRPQTEDIADVALDFYGDWSAGTHVQNGVRTGLGYTWSLAQGRQSLRLGATYEAATRLDNALRSFDSWSAQATWSGQFDTQGALQLTLTYSDVDSQSAAVARQSWVVAANYALPNPVMGADLSLGLNHGEITYDAPLYGPDPRADSRTVLSARAAISAIEVMGFSPVIELSRERVRSNITLFGTEATNLSLTVQSQF